MFTFNMSNIHCTYLTNGGSKMPPFKTNPKLKETRFVDCDKHIKKYRFFKVYNHRSQINLMFIKFAKNEIDPCQTTGTVLRKK